KFNIIATSCLLMRVTSRRVIHKLLHDFLTSIQLTGSVNGDTFLVLDYVEGEDLSSWLSREAP
ncbi:hypothetical protein Pmar_PMAR000664, partial [Perkinsus marinus ATCC 50983]